MQVFFARLFSENNSDLKIGLFDAWHFLYLFIIFGTCALMVILFKNKPYASKERVLRLFA